MRKDIVILGGSGILGQALIRELTNGGGVGLHAPTHAELDITNPDAVSRYLMNIRPYAVINAAANINVDVVEQHPELAWAINADGARVVAEAIAGMEEQARLIHVSTNYVFGDARDRYVEDDAQSPVNVYGETKAAGERYVVECARSAGYPYYILRTSWLFGEARETFVDAVAQTLRAGKTVEALTTDFGNPTYTVDMAHTIIQQFLTGERASGIYHVVNAVGNERGGVSRYEIARYVARVLQISETQVHEGKAIPFKTRRPATAVLVNTKLPPLPTWEASLQRYILGKYGQDMGPSL